MRNDNEKKTVIAQSEEHLKLLQEGWKPSYAYQSFDHTEMMKDGHFVGHNLKPISKLVVIMERQRHDKV